LLRFEESEPLGTRSFFTEIIASISDIKFARGGRYILSRDYMTLKLWDVNMEAAPVATFRVHEYLRPKVGGLILSVVFCDSLSMSEVCRYIVAIV
jgi:hypothetical protein